MEILPSYKVLGDYMRSQRMRQLSLQRLNVSDSQVPPKGGLGRHVICVLRSRWFFLENAFH